MIGLIPERPFGLRAALSLAIMLLLVLGTALCGGVMAVDAGGASPFITDLSVMTDMRCRLTEDYCRVHYGYDGHELQSPKMIVVHYTAFKTLRDSYEFFRPAHLQPSRTDIRSGGNVNIAAHYLVDKNGAIYRLAPDNEVCRHTIGFNHVALGIENVGRDSGDLTDAQITADALLIRDLVGKYPTIEYLIGHHEYMKASLPHFVLFRELDHAYRPTVKNDPGPAFMKKLRSRLLEDYGIHLKD